MLYHHGHALMYVSYYLLPAINQPHDPASLRCRLRHDCGLSPGIDKSFNMVTVDIAVNVEHDDGAEGLRAVFHGQLHVSVDVLVLDLLGNQPLGLKREKSLSLM